MRNTENYLHVIQVCRASEGRPNRVGDPDLHGFGPPRSASISQRYGYGSGTGSFPFLIKMLSGLKYCLQNKILTQNFFKN
jgi:hypothetical protein